MACTNTGCCWCNLCQGARLQRFQGVPLGVLIGRFKLHTIREHRCMDQLFEELLQTSAYEKLIKLAIQRETAYSKPGNFFKYSDRFQHWTDEERQSLVKKINEAAWIYDNIETIDINLSLVRKDASVDIRRLSMAQLYSAKDLTWCHRYAATLTRKSNKPETLSYFDEKFNLLIEKVMTDPCFRAVDGDPTKVASLGARIQSMLLRRMRKDHD